MRGIFSRMNDLGQNIKRLRAAAGLSQRALGEACGWEAQSAQARVGNYEQNKREPSLGDLRLIATALDVSLTELLGEPHQVEESAGKYASIPQYTARGGAGSGLDNDHVEVKGELVFKRDWLSRQGLRESNLYAIYAVGLSMEPTIADGDVLLIDESQRTPLDRRIYALRRPNGDISIKRLIQQHTGGWLIRSDNPNKAEFPDEPASDTEIGHLEIAGRVVWHGGAL